MPSSLDVEWTWRIDEGPWQPLPFAGRLLRVAHLHEPEPTAFDGAFDGAHEGAVPELGRGQVRIDHRSTEGFRGVQTIDVSTVLVELDHGWALVPGLSTVRSDGRSGVATSVTIESNGLTGVSTPGESTAWGERWALEPFLLPDEISFERAVLRSHMKKSLSAGAFAHREQTLCWGGFAGEPRVEARVVVRSVDGD